VYLQLGRLVAQKKVAERTLAQREEMLGLTRQRVTAGLDTALELTQSEARCPMRATRSRRSTSRSCWPATRWRRSPLSLSTRWTG
jgi:outer membrane protein TolC